LEDDQVLGLFIGPTLHSNSNINFVDKMMATWINSGWPFIICQDQ